jgi:hypothetical protein
MNYEEAEQIVKSHISETEDLFSFKGFDFGDTSWRGYYSDDFRLNTEEEEYLFLDGNIYFSVDSDGKIEYVEIENINDFEHFDKYGNTISKFN